VHTDLGAWLAFQRNLSFGTAVAQGVLPFLAVDAAKVVLAALIAARIAPGFRRHFFL
jgi:biotin transporter BioY